MAQLAERLLPISEVHGSNPVIKKLKMNVVIVTVEKKKRLEMAHLKNK